MVVRKRLVLFLSFFCLSFGLIYARQLYGISIWDERRYLSGELNYLFTLERTILVDFIYYSSPLFIASLFSSIILYILTQYFGRKTLLLLISPSIITSIFVASKEQLTLAFVAFAILFWRSAILSYFCLLVAVFIRPIFVVVLLYKVGLDKLISAKTGLLIFCLSMVFGVFYLLFENVALIQDYSRQFSDLGRTNRDYSIILSKRTSEQILPILQIGFLGVTIDDYFNFESFVFLSFWLLNFTLLCYAFYMIFKKDQALFYLSFMFCVLYVFYTSSHTFGNVGSALRYQSSLLVAIMLLYFLKAGNWIRNGR